MKYVVKIIDCIAFALFGAVFALLAVIILSATVMLKKRARDGGAVNELTFAIFDLISNKYSSMFEDALLNGYISRHFYIYLDFHHDIDRFENMQDKIFFYSFAAHPGRGLYKAGFRRMNSLIVELKILARAFMIAKGGDISFVKSHDPHLLGLNGLMIAKLFRLPCVLHMNSDFDMKYRGTGKIAAPVFMSRSLERSFEKTMILSYDLIVADRQFYRKSKNFPRNRIDRYIPFGVRVDGLHYSDPSSRRNIKGALGLSSKKVLLYVGRLHPVKYPDDTIKAFGIVKKLVKDSVLLIVGAGVLRDYLEKLAESEGVSESVIFLGPKRYEELVDILSSADVFLAPHGGMTLVESALASTPMVAYDFDWHGEVVEDGKTGYIVPFRDIEGLAAKTLDLLLNDGLRSAMGEYCRKTALSRYSRERSIEKEKEAYNLMLNS